MNRKAGRSCSCGVRADTNSLRCAARISPQRAARRSGSLTGDLSRTEEHGPRQPGRDAPYIHSFDRPSVHATARCCLLHRSRRRRGRRSTTPPSSARYCWLRAYHDAYHGPQLTWSSYFGYVGGWRLCDLPTSLCHRIVRSGQPGRTHRISSSQRAVHMQGGREFYSVLLGAGRSLPDANPSSPPRARACGVRLQTGVYYSGAQSPPVELLSRRRRRRRHRRGVTAPGG